MAAYVSDFENEYHCGNDRGHCDGCVTYDLQTIFLQMEIFYWLAVALFLLIPADFPKTSLVKVRLYPKKQEPL